MNGFTPAAAVVVAVAAVPAAAAEVAADPLSQQLLRPVRSTYFTGL